MPGVTDAGSIRLLLAGPTVLRTFGFALLGRLAYGVLPLCFLFTVRDATGSFAVAAASSATLGFATLTMPVQSRLVDRHGQRRALPAFAGAYIILLGLGAALAPAVASTAVWLLLGLGLGLTGPALGPAMRAQWREITDEGPGRRRAYSVDAVGEESLYLVGPLVAGVVLATGSARAGLLLTAALVGIGTLALVCSPYRPSPAACPGPAAPGPSARGQVVRPLLRLLAVLALFGGGGAAVFVGIASLADRVGRPGVAGMMEAAMAAGAVVGGLLWARFGRAEPLGRILAALLGLLALAQVATAAVVPGLVAVGVVLGAGMLVASPVFVIAFSAADALVPARRRTEASTWVTVGANAGTAVGTAVAGLVAGAGAAAPFALGAVLTGVAALAALAVRPPGG